MRRSTITRALAVAAAAMAMAPAAAQAACTRVDVNPIFQDLDGDQNLYFVAPGGTFDGAGITTTGATSFVDPTHTLGRVGVTSALSLGSGATVTTGGFCVDNDRPWLRFLVKPAALSGALKVEAVGADGIATELAVVTPSTTSWRGTALLPLSSKLAIPAGGDRTMRIRLTALGGWQVDGLAVDPYRF